MRYLQILTLMLCGLVAAACGTIAEPERGAAAQTVIDTAKLERGIEVYRANYCGSCHTLAAANTRGTFGPDHNDAASVAEEYIALDTYNGQAMTAERYIRESLLEPAVFYTPGYETTNHHMPAFTHLTPEDIDALIYLLMNQTEE